MGPEERRRHVEGAFRVLPSSRSRIRGREVILIDDVLTTGATARSAAAALGEVGVELLLKGARVIPEKAEATGYEFLFPELEDSLRHQLGRPEES